MYVCSYICIRSCLCATSFTDLQRPVDGQIDGPGPLKEYRHPKGSKSVKSYHQLYRLVACYDSFGPGPRVLVWAANSNQG